MLVGDSHALMLIKGFQTLAAEQGWRTFETVTRVTVSDPFGVARAWVPLPLVMDTGWHRTLDNAWVVITADHGEAFGEFGIFGHPCGTPLPELIVVPYLAVA